MKITKTSKGGDNKKLLKNFNSFEKQTKPEMMVKLEEVVRGMKGGEVSSKKIEVANSFKSKKLDLIFLKKFCKIILLV